MDWGRVGRDVVSGGWNEILVEPQKEATEENAKAMKDTAAKSTEATVLAAKVYTEAAAKAQELAKKAAETRRTEDIAAAKEAEQKANEAIAKASITVEAAMQAGADFSNAEFAKAHQAISTAYTQAYTANTANFRETYAKIKDEFQQGYGEVSKTLAPWITTGETANKKINAMMGFEGPEAAKNALMTDPAYQFRVEQGQKAIERSAAGGGFLRSGNTGIELQKYGQNITSDEFTNAFNRLMMLSTQGQSGASTKAAYAWNLGEKNAANEQLLSGQLTGAESDIAAKRAALADYLANVRAGNEWQVQKTKGQNALNIANTKGTGAWNVADATRGGNAALAQTINQGAWNVADVTGKGATMTANALSNQAYMDMNADILRNNFWPGVINQGVQTGIALAPMAFGAPPIPNYSSNYGGNAMNTGTTPNYGYPNYYA